MNDGITLLLYYLMALRVLFNIIYGQYKPLIIKTMMSVGLPPFLLLVYAPKQCEGQVSPIIFLPAQNPYIGILLTA